MHLGACQDSSDCETHSALGDRLVQESQKLLDFSTMLDIYAALVGSVVHRLKWSWQLVPEPLHQAMADIESLLSLSSYCKDFRLLHERSIARPCVPSLYGYRTQRERVVEPHVLALLLTPYLDRARVTRSAFIGHIHFLRDSSTNKLKVMHSVYSTISVRCCSVPTQCHLDVVSHATLGFRWSCDSRPTWRHFLSKSSRMPSSRTCSSRYRSSTRISRSRSRGNVNLEAVSFTRSLETLSRLIRISVSRSV